MTNSFSHSYHTSLCVCTRVHAFVSDKLPEWVRSCHHLGPGNQTHMPSFGSKHYGLLSHRSGLGKWSLAWNLLKPGMIMFGQLCEQLYYCRSTSKMVKAVTLTSPDFCHNENVRMFRILGQILQSPFWHPESDQLIPAVASLPSGKGDWGQRGQRQKAAFARGWV